MANDVRKVLTVFLASPGDLADERRLAKKHVDEWNEVNGPRENWIVELLGWEDTLPQAGRPQAVINKDVQRCALFIGMMWRKWGTRPDGPESPFSSGFEEEFELASQRNTKYGLPQLAMFFKDPGSTDDAGPALSKVLAFKQRLIGEKKVLYKEFADDAQAWNDDFRRILHRLIFDQIAALDAREAERASESYSESPGKTSQELTTVEEWQFDRVKKVLADFSSRRSESELTDLDVARLRLAALAIRRSTLSDTHLENHDANLLFNGRASLSLSGQEMRELIDAALASSSIEVMPLWGWIADDLQLLRNYLKSRAIRQGDQTAIGALKALTIIAEPITDEFRHKLHEAFAEAASPYRIQALAYLRRVGSTDDLKLTDAEVSRGDYATKEAALRAALSIRGRTSQIEPLKYLIESAVDAPLQRWAEESLKAADLLDDSLLRKGLGHRTNLIRVTCARALRQRRQLHDDEIAQLKSDSSAAARLEAVLADIAKGNIRTIRDANRIIAPPKPFSAGVLSLFGTEGEEEKRVAAEAIFEELDDQSLTEASFELYQPAEIAYEVRARNHFAKLGDEVRRDIDDRFSAHYDTALALLQNRLGAAAAEPLVQQFNGTLRDSRVEVMLKHAGRVLIQKGTKQDLERIRSLLSNGAVRLTARYLNFLKKWGGEEDIALINACLGLGRGILQIVTDEADLTRKAAAVVYGLADRDLGLLVSLGLRGNLLQEIIRLSEKKRFAALSDDQVMSLLFNDSDGVRRATAIKVAATRNKGSITALMESVIQRGVYYYNTVHWLDFGRTVPRKLVLEAERWDVGL